VQEIYNATGYPEFIKELSETDPLKYSSAISWLKHQTCPRAQIYRRDQGKVSSLEDMKQMMRYNDWRRDPVRSGGHCNDDHDGPQWLVACRHCLRHVATVSRTHLSSPPSCCCSSPPLVSSPTLIPRLRSAAEGTSKMGVRWTRRPSPRAALTARYVHGSRHVHGRLRLVTVRQVRIGDRSNTAPSDMSSSIYWHCLDLRSISKIR